LGSVFAFREELDRWSERRSSVPVAPQEVKSKPAKQAWATQMAWGTGAAALVVLAIAGWMISRGLTAKRIPNATLAAGLNGSAVAARFFTDPVGHGSVPMRLITVGTAPRAAVLAAGGARLYVSNWGSNSVSVVDTDRLTTLATLPLGWPPTQLRASSDGSRVYVAGSHGIATIATATGAVQEVGFPKPVLDIALTPDGRWLYVALGYDGLARVNTATLEVSHFSTPACPVSLAVAPDGGTLYVGFQCGGPAGRPGHDSIGEFSLPEVRLTHTLGGDVPLVGSPMAVTRDGAQLWVGNADACTEAGYDHRGCRPDSPWMLYVFNTATRQLLREVPSSAAVGEINFSRDGGLAIVSAGRLHLMDTTRLATMAVLPVSAGSSIMSADGTRLFVPMTDRNAVAVLASQNECTPPADDLDAWWPGDGSADDAWGMLAGHASPAVQYVPGRVGQAFGLAGPAARVDFGRDLKLAREWRDQLTVVAWIRPARMTPGIVLSHGWSLALQADGRVAACFPDHRCMVSHGALHAGEWSQVALSSTLAGTATLYIDGRAEATRTVARGNNPREADFIVGGSNFVGAVDEIAMYEKALDGADLEGLEACAAPIGR